MSNLPSLTFPLSFINDSSSPIQRLIVDIVNQSKAVTVNNDCLWNDFCKDKSFLQKFREKNIRSNIPETLANLLSEIDTNYDDTNIVAYHENEAWTFSFSARFRSLSILKSAVLPDEPVAVKVSEPVVAPVEKVVEVVAPAEPVVEVAAPVEPVAEVAAPAEPVAEVVAPAEPVVEVAAPVEKVVEVTAPVEKVVEVTAPAEPVVEVAAPVEPVAEVAAPAEPVAEVAAPAEPVAEVAAPSSQ